MDKRAAMGAVGDLNQYTKYQTAEAIRDAANNPSGGAAGIGVGLGAGMGMANQMLGAMQPGASPGATTGAAATPPPLPGAVQFYAAVDGKQAGPFDLAALQAHISEGKISRETLVWKQGMANWAAASTVGELQNLFAAVPPPLPPQ
jgi:hypothetical protein